MVSHVPRLRHLGQWDIWDTWDSGTDLNINDMNNYNQPYLEKYTGRASRHKCPKCGDPHSFAYYLDGNTGLPIDKTVGRCNHESGCGYHYTPKQFFIDNPVEKERFVSPVQQKPIQKPQRKIGYIPFQYVEKSASYNSSFVCYLCG